MLSARSPALCGAPLVPAQAGQLLCTVSEPCPEQAPSGGCEAKDDAPCDSPVLDSMWGSVNSW